MSSYVKSIQAIGIHGRFDLEHEFEPGVNILHGKNGSGKTTLLHILANILNRAYERFAFLSFDSIKVQLDDNKEVILRQERGDKTSLIHVQRTGFPDIELSIEDIARKKRREEISLRRDAPRQLALFEDTIKQLSEEEVQISTAYFPAFRTMIEAWASAREERTALGRVRYTGISPLDRAALNTGQERQRATLLARQLFGQFVPSISYPSPLEIELNLSKDFEDTVVEVARTSQELFSQTVLDIFAALSKMSGQVEEKPATIIEEIRLLSIKLGESSFGAGSMLDEGFFTKLGAQIDSYKFTNTEGVALNILDVYRKFFAGRVSVQENSFEGIRRYLKSVNEFLEGKNLDIYQQVDQNTITPLVQIKFNDGSYSGLQALSSGERQIITMIYAASKMSSQKIVLIDEPEISLHIDWQRLLLKKMSEQLPGRQIIACTHSPVIGADYEDRLVELRLKATKNISPKVISTSDYSHIDDEEELF